MRRIGLIIVFATLGTLNSSGAQEPAPPSEDKETPKYLEVTPRIGTGAQPTEAGLKTLAERGYRAVISLRTAQEPIDLGTEEKFVRSLGLQYYNIPVVGTDPKKEQASAFLKIMDELRDEKTFIQCGSGNRVGGLLMIYRVLEDGLSVDQAEAEARRVGLRGDVLVKFAKEFIAEQKSE